MKLVVKKAVRISILCFVAFALAMGGLYLAIVQPGGSGVVASLQLPDGSEYRVTQRCNWSAEPYTVSFYMRSPDGEWGWCYIDHQASRWRDVALTYDATSDAVIVTERGTWKAALDRTSSMFSIGDGKPKREVDAPQSEAKRPKFTSSGSVSQRTNHRRTRRGWPSRCRCGAEVLKPVLTLTQKSKARSQQRLASL